MRKGVELLNHLLDSYIDEQNYDYVAYIEIEKSLKALKIIKNKRVNIDNFLNHITRNIDYKEYEKLHGLFRIMVFSNKKLTQEEYELLKEVLL